MDEFTPRNTPQMNSRSGWSSYCKTFYYYLLQSSVYYSYLSY
jgi:hypothetical protein